MITANVKKVLETTDSAKMELYELIDEGYQAMLDGQVSTVEEVREFVKMRRIEVG